MSDPYEPVSAEPNLGSPPLPPRDTAADIAAGRVVVAQSQDNSPDNTNPVTTRQLIAQAVGVAVAIGLYKGVLQPAEGDIITTQTAIIVSAVLSLAGILGSIAGRMKAYSPKTVAKIAVVNAQAPAGAPPTLMPPP